MSDVPVCFAALEPRLHGLPDELYRPFYRLHAWDGPSGPWHTAHRLCACHHGGSGLCIVVKVVVAVDLCVIDDLAAALCPATRAFRRRGRASRASGRWASGGDEGGGERLQPRWVGCGQGLGGLHRSGVCGFVGGGGGGGVAEGVVLVLVLVVLVEGGEGETDGVARAEARTGTRGRGEGRDGNVQPVRVFLGSGRIARSRLH